MKDAPAIAPARNVDGAPCDGNIAGLSGQWGLAEYCKPERLSEPPVPGMRDAYLPWQRRDELGTPYNATMPPTTSGWDEQDNLIE